jgi:acyl carrier protein
MKRESSCPDEKSAICNVIFELATERGYLGPLPPADQPLRDIGFDSLLTIKLIAALEEQLEIEFPDSALNLDSFSTIESTMRLVQSLR